MRAIRLGLALLCCLTACSQAEGNVYRSSNQPRTIGNGLSVTVTNVTSEAEAVPIADQYCKAQGKAALFNKMVMLTYHHVSSNSASFDCATSAS
jgi:hypothetical protein